MQDDIIMDMPLSWEYYISWEISRKYKRAGKTTFSRAIVSLIIDSVVTAGGCIHKNLKACISC